MKKDILIDLDGVLNEYNGEYDENYIPNPAKGAKEFLQNLKKDFTIILFTTRNPSLAQKWLDDNNLSDYINSITNIKQPCFLYIDDRAICHNGDFNSTLEAIKNFKVHWKN